MDRALRLANIWNYLPVFRVLAETEHLPTAAAHLNVSASAVSRSVKLLEDHLGYLLFVRTGRALRLNESGRALLLAVRDSMRTVDDGLVHDAAVAQRIRVAGESPWLDMLVIPAHDAGAEGWSSLEVVDVEPDDIGPALLRGELDLALASAIEPQDEIAIERLGTIASALFHVPGLAITASTPHASWTRADDGWPPDVPRRVALRSARLDVIRDACLRGQFAAVLPVALARDRGLVAAPAPAIASATLFLVRRDRGGPVRIIEKLRELAARTLT